MRTRPLPVSRPSDQGVDARGILDLLDALDAHPDIEMHGLMVLRHGRVVAAGWWSPYTPDRPHLLYSLSKSFTSTALGLAVAEGLVGLDDRILDHFPELEAEVTDPGSRSIRLRHVAAMASGHLTETWDRAVAADPAEPVRGFLLLPPEREPGTVFAYNQSATYSLAAVLQRVTGQTLTDYLRPRLFDPLGVGDVGWQQGPPGRDVGFTGLHATTDAVARLGQLYLQRGLWDGRRLLPEDWVAEATRAHVANPREPEPDWRQGYGYQFWRSRHGYRGDGAYGQFCLVLPDQDLVVATTAATPAMQAVLDAVWTHVLPAVDRRPSAVADDALAERLQHLALPPVDAKPEPPGDRDAWVAGHFAPADGTCPGQPSLTSVEVTDTGRGWRIRLVEDGQGGAGLEMDLGRDHWAVSTSAAAGSASREAVPTAVSGGWLDAQRLRFDVIFLETPHRLRVTCTLPGRTFEAGWRTVPMRVGGLGELASPAGATGRGDRPG